MTAPSYQIPDAIERINLRGNGRQDMLLELSAADERLQQVYEELLATCTSMEDTHVKLEQEKEELEATIKELMNRLYG